MTTLPETKRSYSLRWALVRLILLCWVLPVLIFAGGSVYYISENARTQMVQNLRYEFEDAVNTAKRNVTAAMDASRKVSYDSAVRDAYTRYKLDDNRVELYARVTDFMNDQYRYDNTIADVHIFFTEKPEHLYSISNHSLSGMAARTSFFQEHVLEQTTKISKTLGTDIRFYVAEDSVYLIRNIMDRTYYPYAVIVINLNLDHIFSDLFSLPREKACALIMDREKVGLKGAIPDFIPKDQFKEFTEISRTGSGYSFRIQSGIEGHRIAFAAEASGAESTETTSVFLYLLLFASAMAILLMFFFMYSFYRNVNRPLDSLVKASREITGGKLGFQTDFGHNSNEFNHLAVAFNQMSSDLREMFDRRLEEQAALHEAQIDALQSQINPHFLNNTLEIINWETRMAGAERAGKMIEALSTMLSAAMARDGASMISLVEELAYLDSYLYIITARLGDRLTVQKEIDESLLTEKVPRLIMQPLVENAVEHGIISRRQGGITLRACRREGTLILEVENDGEISPENQRLLSIRLEKGPAEGEAPRQKLGVRNVHMRLRLLYGKDSGLTITARDGKTIARITIPSPEAPSPDPD